MASELQISYGVSGLTLYSVIRTTVGTVWNGAAFVAFVGANWSTYAVTMTEQGTSGYYVGNFPIVALGVYNVETRVQAGGSPALTDLPAGSGIEEWTGTAVTSIASRLAPTTPGNSLDVTATGGAGIDWANVENPTTAVNLSATNIDVDQIVASVSGAVGSVTGAVGSVTGNVGGNVAGTVGSVVGAVGSVAGNVSGNVVGSVGTTPTASAQLVKVLAAVYDSATASGDVITLSNGTTQTIDETTGTRTTVE